MKAIAAALVAASILSVCGNTNEIRLPEIKVGTNTYKRATITKRNPVEAVIRYDGGITKVKISDLPPEIANKWYDASEANRFSEDRNIEIKQSAEQVAVAERVRKMNELRNGYLEVNGALLPKTGQIRVSGYVVRAESGGLILSGPERDSPRRTYEQRSGAAVRFTPQPNELGTGVLALVKNAPPKPSGSFVTFTAFRTERTENVNGRTLKVYDCGRVPGIELLERFVTTRTNIFNSKAPTERK